MACRSTRNQVKSIKGKTDLAREFYHSLDFVAVVTEISAPLGRRKTIQITLFPGWMKAQPGLPKNKTTRSGVCLLSKMKQKLLHQICWKVLATKVVANWTCPEPSFGSGAGRPAYSALFASRYCSRQHAQWLLCATSNSFFPYLPLQEGKWAIIPLLLGSFSDNVPTCFILSSNAPNSPGRRSFVFLAARPP